MLDSDLLEEFCNRFDSLPSPEHEPKRFGAYVKMFKYFKEKENGKQTKPTNTSTESVQPTEQ